MSKIIGLYISVLSIHDKYFWLNEAQNRENRRSGGLVYKYTQVPITMALDFCLFWRVSEYFHRFFTRLNHIFVG